MRPLSRLPMPLVLVLAAALAMLVPAAYASVNDLHRIARSFFYSSLLVLVVTGMIAVAMGMRTRSRDSREALLTVVAFFTLLPLVLALPFAQSLPDTGLLNAWWEMVSSLTTTGASLYSADLLPAPLHLWRGLVGWMGGFFVLTSATAILAPLRLGGFEMMLPTRDDSGPGRRNRADPDSHQSSPGFHTRFADPGYRLLRAAAAIAPAYGGLTLALWVILLMLGDGAFLALMRAMGTLSTSGISPILGPVGETSGMPGEAAVILFLLPALSRRFWPGGAGLRASQRLRDDPELRMAAAIVGLVTLALFARHFVWAIEMGEGQPGNALSVAWGAAFNALSYLTTTGWSALDWKGVRLWSGFDSPGLMLAGLAMMGGGVATTAGGVKLLRVYALARHGERELGLIIHPSSVAGGGTMARHLRSEGAYLAFIFFMLFAVSIAGTVTLVTIRDISFETATILSIAALSNTGQLAGTIALNPAFEGTAGIASAPWEGWSGLPGATKIVLALAMIVGRIETLAILALFTGEFWRR